MWFYWFNGRIFYRCVDWNHSACAYLALIASSHLLQMRGLKQILRLLPVAHIVASFTDAWIETLNRSDMYIDVLSHLLQMRGLKLTVDMIIHSGWSRIFYRCVDWNRQYKNRRGGSGCRIFYRCVDWNKKFTKVIYLKESRIFYRCVDWNNKNIVCRKPRNVASFTDAWIETVVVNIVNWVNMSHLLQMRGLKHSKYLIMTLSKSRIFYRCVDWNAEYILVTFKAFCRIFYRCVDWNLKDRNLPLPSAVASFTDAWIETLQL